MVVGVVRRSDRIRRQLLADAERLVTGLRADAFVARPPEVIDDGVAAVDDAIDFLPRVPSDVANPQFVRAGPDGKPEWIPQAVRDNALAVRVRITGPRVVGQRGAGVGMDPDDAPVQRDWIAARADVLTAQSAALARRVVGRRRGRRLAVVGVVEART